jgi:glycosyltransferase involved in cell wall biosynthesis
VAARYGIRAPYVLSVGTIEPRKNLRRLFDAFGSIAGPAAPDAPCLVLAGAQGWDADLLPYVAQHPLRERIRILGFVPEEDLPALYSAARVVAYPSLYEGFGLPVLEAMCCGAVVLTSGVSAMPEVLGDAGLYCRPDHTEDIARGLHEVLRMRPCERDTLGHRAAARAGSLLADWAAAPPLPGLTGWS